MKTNDSVMREKNESGVAYKNPSYDKSLPPRDRLGDFLGKYHVVLNGVVKHDPFVKSEDDGGGMCCQDHKVEILDFVDNLYSHSLAEARREWVEEMRGKVNDMKYRGIAHSDLEARRHNALLEKIEDLLTGDNPERKV